MSTFFAKKQDLKDKKWHVVDAKDQVVGRIATQIAMILMGKDKTSYTPHVDSGDGVIVINTAQARMTGRKNEQKNYKFYSGYPGGLKEKTYDRMMKEDPTYALKHAVKGMLPKSRMGMQMITHLLLYPGADHPHQAQKPKISNIKA